MREKLRKGEAIAVVLLISVLAFAFVTPTQAAGPPRAKKGDILTVVPLPPLPSFPPLKPLPSPATTTTDPLGNLMAQLEQLQAAAVTGVIADINAADADASIVVTPAIPAQPAVPAVLAADGVTVVTPAIPAQPMIPAAVKDPISHACYPAAVRFLQTLPVMTTPTGKFVGVQLFQQKRDFIAQIQAGLPTYIKLGCAPLLGDEINTFIQIMAMVGVKVLPAAATAIFPALAPITLPAMAITP